MSTLVSTIKSTKWIDLSPKHKDLREFIETQVKQACVDKIPTSPIMIKGAFGIGKTNTLHYIFHYGWCELKTPVFFISLEQLLPRLEKLAKEQPSGKINNVLLGQSLNEILQTQIESIRTNPWETVQEIFFDFFLKNSLDTYLKDIKPLELFTEGPEEKFETKIFNVFSEEIIREAIDSGNRPVLLIDEFETKFYKLKGIIESSGGGILRDLFDKVVNDRDSFYLIIGNGPASGYEIGKEFDSDSFQSETAASRRLQSRQIPFPTPNLLSKSFLKGQPRGFINFIWWLSRCRPGHILKLSGDLGKFNEQKQLNYAEFINQNKIFNESIDEQGEAVTYLKTDFFNSVPGKVEGTVLKDIILSIEPQLFDINEIKTELKECVNIFYCASQLINIEKDLLPALKADFYEKHLAGFQASEKYTDVSYLEHIRPYFSYILSAIADKDGNIAFGMINDNKPDQVLARVFLLPFLELTYDFISLYEDDSVHEIKQALDFILELINHVSDSLDNDELENVIPNTFDIFEKCKLNRNDRVYLQQSFFSIRESIEQPIGSPQLAYKTKKIQPLFSKINSKTQNIPIIFYKSSTIHLYFIPDLPEESLKIYLKSLNKYLYNVFNEKYHKDGEVVTRVIYIEDSDAIKTFRKDLLFIDDLTPEPIYMLKKIDVVSIDTYQLNFGRQIRDFIDSLVKIALVGFAIEDFDKKILESNNGIINLPWIVDQIKNPTWTEKKEVRRAIEHYEKMLFDGENSSLNSISKVAVSEYELELENRVANKDEFRKNIRDFSYIDHLINDEKNAFNEFTKRFLLLLLIDNKYVPESLLGVLKTLHSDLKFSPDSESCLKQISFSDLSQVFQKNDLEIKEHFKEFNLESSFISSLKSLSELLLCEKELKSLTDFAEYMRSYEVHFMKSYHKALGSSLRPELSEALYNYCYLNKLDVAKKVEQINESIIKVEDDLTTVRRDLSQNLEELREVLLEKETLFTYNDKLGKASTTLGKLKMLLEESGTLSSCLLITSILTHFKVVVEESKKFQKQIEKICSMVQTQKDKVEAYQEKIDALYNDPFTSKIIKLEYPTPRNDNYLWRVFFIGTLKNSDASLSHGEAYEKLFGNKSAYNPYYSPTIYDDKLISFEKQLNEVFNKKQKDFEKLLSDLSVIQENVLHITQLESYVNELLEVKSEQNGK